MPAKQSDQLRLNIFAHVPTTARAAPSASRLRDFALATPTFSQDPNSAQAIDGRAVKKPRRRRIPLNLFAVGHALGKLFKGENSRETAQSKSNGRIINYNAYLKIEVYANENDLSPLHTAQKQVTLDNAYSNWLPITLNLDLDEVSGLDSNLSEAEGSPYIKAYVINQGSTPIWFDDISLEIVPAKAQVLTTAANSIAATTPSAASCAKSN